jgi:hypothetical protein
MTETLDPRSLKRILEIMREYNVTHLTMGSLSLTRDSHVPSVPQIPYEPIQHDPKRSPLETQLDDLLEMTRET